MRRSVAQRPRARGRIGCVRGLPAGAFLTAQLVADSHAVEGDWQAAADAMEDRAACLALPAPRWLSEICVDGMLERD